MSAPAALDCREMRRLILRQSKRADVGHIGSALSVVELVAAVYGSALRCAHPGDPGRDRFVLSKGHAALALYAALHLKGWLAEADLDSYGRDNTALGVHPERRLPGIDFCTGSMGMGLGFGAGAALAARLQASDRRAFVVLSDAECNEGSVWEAAMFASQHGLGNLTALLDHNRQQALGPTREILDSDNLAGRWASFGWEVIECDGHDRAGLERTLAGLNYGAGRPHLLLARTILGKGVSFMEGRVKWHYWPMNEPEYAQALREVEDAPR